jgi:hypothetical protein
MVAGGTAGYKAYQRAPHPVQLTQALAKLTKILTNKSAVCPALHQNPTMATQQRGKLRFAIVW